MRLGNMGLSVLHTPGHTPGSVSFFFRHAASPTDGAKDASRFYVFTGDTLFRRGIGRTDLGGGDSYQIMKSIEGKLLALPNDSVVIAGHGPSTTIGEERTANPFLARR